MARVTLILAFLFLGIIMVSARRYSMDYMDYMDYKDNMDYMDYMDDIQTSEINVALNKPAKQSSTYPGCRSNSCAARLANDGNLNTRSVTAGKSGDEWWEVDLEESIYLDKIVLYFTAYALRTNKYQQLVVSTRNSETDSWSVCKNVGEAETSPFTVTCDHPTIARYVRLTLKNDETFYLAEVQVYEVNMALNKPAKQSSTYASCRSNSCDAKLANDGNLDTRSVTAGISGDEWWEVNLEESVKIREIVLYLTPLRKNKYQELVVLTKDKETDDWSVCKNVGKAETSPFTVTCDHPTWARYVRLTLKNEETFYLAEVNVYAEPEINVALNKPAKQSSTYPDCRGNSCDARLANDGNLKTRSVTAGTSGDQWWEVDLEESIIIDRIVLYLTAHALRKKKYQQLVVSTRNSETDSWSVCKNVGSVTSSPFIVTCDNPTEAQYIRLTLKNLDTFYLAEVEVYAA